MAEKILLIDDDDGYLLAAKSLPEGAGYRVGDDGFTFAEELSKDQAVADVPVILVSAVAQHVGQTLYAFERGRASTPVDVLGTLDVSQQLVSCVTSALGTGEGSAGPPSQT